MAEFPDMADPYQAVIQVRTGVHMGHASYLHTARSPHLFRNRHAFRRRHLFRN